LPWRRKADDVDPMRIILALLLAANLAFFGYTRLDGPGSGEASRLAEQVQPDRIRLLTPQQVATLGPAKVAALADVCLEWGPFGDGDRARALAELEPAGLGRLLTQKRVENATAYWVFVPRLANKAAADKRAAELKAAGIKDPAVVDSGPQRFAISLGVFRTEEAATAYVAELGRLGVADARAGPRQQVVVQTQLVVRDPVAAVVTRVKTLQPAFPGSEIVIGACEKT
jgi:hypothetical protein